MKAVFARVGEGHSFIVYMTCNIWDGQERRGVGVVSHVNKEDDRRQVSHRQKRELQAWKRKKTSELEIWVQTQRQKLMTFNTHVTTHTS